MSWMHSMKKTLCFFIWGCRIKRGRGLLQSLSQREETWAGSVLHWNPPHWHLTEPKPHSGSLESREEWQHFLHPFRVPQYGKHLDLFKKKSHTLVCSWIFFYLVVFLCKCKFCKGNLLSENNNKLEPEGELVLYLIVWSLVRIVLCFGFVEEIISKFQWK